MTNIAHEISTSWALLRANLQVYALDWKRTCVQSFFMLLQNTIFFIVWVFYFDTVKEMDGWVFKDLSTMFGLIATSVGVSLFLFDGLRSLAMKVQDGSFDSYLTRPTHPLPALMFSRSCMSSLGDVLTGPVYWLVFAKVGWGEMLMLMALSLIMAVLFTAFLVIIVSLNLFSKDLGRLTEQLTDVWIISSSVPLHTQPLFIKIIVFTVLPAGFQTYLPMVIVRDFSFLWLGVLLGAAVLYSALALGIFQAGVRRYKRS